MFAKYTNALVGSPADLLLEGKPGNEGWSDVYSVGSDEIAEFTGDEPPIRSAEILDGVSEVVGPLLNEEGRQIHREFDW